MAFIYGAIGTTVIYLNLKINHTKRRFGIKWNANRLLYFSWFYISFLPN